jgi:hypothetical protein
MPIIFVHGVATRDDISLEPRFGDVPWPQIETHLREHVAPALAEDAEAVHILRAYWGDLAANFAWDGRFRVSDGLEKVSLPERLAPLDPEALGRLIERVLLEVTPDTSFWPDLVDIAWDVARDAEIPIKLQACESLEAETDVLKGVLEAKFREKRQGANKRTEWWWTLENPFRPGLERAARQQRETALRALNSFRRPLEAFVPLFIGDVFTYLSGRGNALDPGPIPERVLGVLSEAHALQKSCEGEPLVVLTHSMGGQIVYDILTHFLPRMPEYKDVHVDFWCASASQVGMFEELKLFLESKPAYCAENGTLAPFPDRRFLGAWWNVWDHADLLSFRAAGIFEGVDDTAFYLGESLQNDHNAYLKNANFYRTLAAKVRTRVKR